MRRNNKKDILPQKRQGSLLCIEKDTRNRVLYAPFACVLMAYPKGFEPSTFRVGV